MSSGAPFVPTPFTTPVVAPSAVTVTRRVPYISVSEYRFAPTAVGTTDLVPGSTTMPADSEASLAQVINRASGWIDQFVFHDAAGTLAASVTNESGWVKVKPNGTVAIIAKYKPILDVRGIALGPNPGNLVSMDTTTAGNIWIENKVIWLPATWGGTIYPYFPFPTFAGGVFAVWSYTNGFPHTALAADVTAGSSTITVQPTAVGGTSVSGVYPGTQLTIHDGGKTESVTVASVSGVVLTLVAHTQYAHTVPAAPDAIRVSAIPWGVEQACISITSVLIKTRGTRAQVLPATPGQRPNRQALGQAGALEDFDLACRLLKPYVTVYMGG